MTLYECSRCSRRSDQLFAGDVADGDLCLPCLRASMRMSLEVDWPTVVAFDAPPAAELTLPAREVVRPPLA